MVMELRGRKVAKPPQLPTNKTGEGKAAGTK